MKQPHLFEDKLPLGTSRTTDPLKLSTGARLVSTEEIYFTQTSVKDKFRDGTLVSSMTEKLLSGVITPEEAPPIRVVRVRNKLYTLDNRRLRAFKDAFMEKVPVVFCQFDDPKIKKEFFNKKTNKAAEGGGVVRSKSTFNFEQKFSNGSYVLSKKILNWNLEQLKQPLICLNKAKPLPSQYETSTDYYIQFLDLIAEEARATLQAGIETSGGESYPLTLKHIKVSNNPENPSTLTLEKKMGMSWPCRANDALLLSYGPENNPVQLLTIASYTPDEENNHIKLKCVIDREITKENENAFEEKARWTAKPIGSVVTHLRMYEACLSQPSVPWLSKLYNGSLAHSSISSIFSLFSLLSLDNNDDKPVTIDTKENFSGLNDSQKKAIESFLTLKSGIQLIQGPPGTGKTTAITALLKCLAPHSRTLVCAPSNKAVQVLAQRFVEQNPNCPAIFAGVEDKIPVDNISLKNIFLHTWGIARQNELNQIEEKLWTLTPEKLYSKEEKTLKSNIILAKQNLSEVENIVLSLSTRLSMYQFSFLNEEELARFAALIKVCSEILFEVLKSSDNSTLFKKLREHLSALSIMISKVRKELYNAMKDDSAQGLEGQLLNHSKIIFSTLSVTGRKLLQEMTSVDHLIVDEAGQAPEAETLIPFATKPKKLLLIGDTKQLPATVISTKAQELGFGRSMMWRLIEECKQPFSMLNLQYRMHPDIRYWPSLKYYDSKLVDAESITTRKLPLLKDAPEFLAPYSFIDVKGKEYQRGISRSYANGEEAQLVKDLLTHFDEKYKIDVNKSVGVITFYKTQAAMICENLPKRFCNVKVSTVDSFQGDEMEIIMVSFVRANNSGTIGFLQDFRRLNVALTRAKHALILIGNAETLKKQDHDIAALLNDAAERKCIYSADEIRKTIAPPPMAKKHHSLFHARHNNVNVHPKKPDAEFKKTLVCRFFNGSPSSCRKGTKCDFVHAKNKVRGFPSPLSP